MKQVLEILFVVDNFDKISNGFLRGFSKKKKSNYPILGMEGNAKLDLMMLVFKSAKIF